MKRILLFIFLIFPMVLHGANASLESVTNMVKKYAQPTNAALTAIAVNGVTNLITYPSSNYVQVLTTPGQNPSINGGAVANLHATEWWSSGAENGGTPFEFATIGYDPFSGDSLAGQFMLRGLANSVPNGEFYGNLCGIQVENAAHTGDNREFVIRVKDPLGGSASEGGGYVLFENRNTNGANWEVQDYNNWLSCDERGIVGIGALGQLSDDLPGYHGFAWVTIQGPESLGTPVQTTFPTLGIKAKWPLIVVARNGGIENSGTNLFYTSKEGTTTNRYAIPTLRDVTNQINRMLSGPVSTNAIDVSLTSTNTLSINTTNVNGTFYPSNTVFTATMVSAGMTNGGFWIGTITGSNSLIGAWMSNNVTTFKNLIP